MNRTIKFRAWDKEAQRIYPVTSFHIYRPEVERGGKYCGVTIKDENGHDKFLDDERAIPMQFTGLLDKNGKEIYEGDILHSINKNTFEVQFIEKSAAFKVIEKSNGKKWMFGYDSQKNFEIIGNIYENPELANN